MTVSELGEGRGGGLPIPLSRSALRTEDWALGSVSLGGGVAPQGSPRDRPKPLGCFWWPRLPLEQTEKGLWDVQMCAPVAGQL